MIHVNDKTFATWEEIKKRQEDPDADMVYEIESVLGIDHNEFRFLWAYQPNQRDTSVAAVPNSGCCYSLTPYEAWHKNQQHADGVADYRPFAIITERSSRGPVIFPTLVYAGTNGKFLYLSIYKGRVFRVCETIYGTKELGHSTMTDLRRFIGDSETLLTYVESALFSTTANNHIGDIMLFEQSLFEVDKPIGKYISTCIEWLAQHSRHNKRFHL